jgi:hypothetical protein
MKRENENLMQKLFGSFALGSGRFALRSNVYNNGGTPGYSPIGGTSQSRIFDGMDRKSPLLGNYMPSSRLSSYYEKLAELKGYQLLDISKLATNFFADYIINFLADESNGAQLVTIMDDAGNKDETKTERINDVLVKDIKIFDFIRDHIQDYVFYGGYYSMLRNTRDELGHLKFRIEELYDPISVVIKKKRIKETDEIEEVFLARSDENIIYEIPKKEMIYISNTALRLVNDLSSDWNDKHKKSWLHEKPKEGGKGTRDKVTRKESYQAAEPLFYSSIIKLKELVIKELLVSLISLRDLTSVQMFLLQFDKAVPLETANELCARATKLANNTNEISSFLTSQFDVVSFIENTLTQSAKFIPDYNSTLGSKNSMLPLDKLSDKLLDIMQTLDQCRNNVLSPLGLPSTILDSTSGSKWQVLQQSERANSRVASFMAGIKDSVTNLVCSIYETLYGTELDPSLIKLHISEKTSVEYNNQINQSESINGLVQGISNIIQTSLQTLDFASPLIDPEAYLTYIHNLLKDIDPNTENLITEETLQQYLQLVQAKVNNSFEQLGVDPSTIQQTPEQR